MALLAGIFGVLATLATLVVGGAGTASGQILLSVPRILDADTVEFSEGRRVRLLGIDAPETEQFCLDAKGEPYYCGKRALDELVRKTKDQQWKCEGAGAGRDKYNRLIGWCTVDGEDIQRWLVRQGLAMSYTRYSRYYEADHNYAKSQRAGMWAGAFIAPWDWRDRNKLTKILGAVSVPIDAQEILLRPDPKARPQSAPQPVPEPSSLPQSAPQTRPVPPWSPPKGPCQSPDDRDSAGNRCGGRASKKR